MKIMFVCFIVVLHCNERCVGADASVEALKLYHMLSLQ